MALPAIVPQHPDEKEHPVVQAEFAPGHGGELCFHLADLTGSQKTAAAQVDAQNRLCVLQREIGLVQNGTVAADGQDHIGTLQAVLLRQVDNAHGAAALPQVFAHQDGGPVRQQDLRCAECDLAGGSLAGIR